MSLPFREVLNLNGFRQYSKSIWTPIFKLYGLLVRVRIRINNYIFSEIELAMCH